MLFGGLLMEDAIRLYFEKRDAIYRGDLTKLNQLRKAHPNLFLAKTIEEIEAVLDYVASIQRHPDFKQRYADYLRNKQQRCIKVIPLNHYKHQQ
jgi:hypothetical protein